MAGNFLSGIAGGATVAVTIIAIDKFSKDFSKAENMLGKLKTVGVGAVTALGAGLAALGVSSTKAAADFEQTTIAFETMLGSAEAGQKMLKEIADFARKTPFTIKDVENNTKKLLAYGIAQEEVLGDMKTLGDIAAGVGTDKLPQLTLAFGQVATAGKLRGQEIRQFTEAGVPLLEALANTMGKSAAEVQELTSAGEIGFEDVRKALESLTQEGGRFEDLMTKQSETVQGKFSNLQDTFILIQREIGQAMLPIIAELADVFLDDLLPAIQPLIPLIGEFLAQSLKAIVDLIVPLMPKLIEMAPTFFELANTILDILIPALELLLPVFEIIIDAIKQALEWLTKLINMAKNSFVGKIIGGIGGLAKTGGQVLSGKKVGDAIIRPNGQIIETDPMDTLIATKNEDMFNGMGGGINIYIDNVNGLDPDEVAYALQRVIKNKVSI